MTMNGETVLVGATPGRFVATVVDNIPLSDRYYQLVFERPEGFVDPGPGTFIHLLLPFEGRFFLRRPFSILGCDANTISLIIVIKGLGTDLLRDIELGEQIDFVGPLGKSFPRLPGKRVIAVGGGVGLAPLYYYRSQWSPEDCETFRLLYGARSKEDLFLDRFEWRHLNVEFSTDDGSHGYSGNVVEMTANAIDESPVDAIFSCGPTPMLKALAELARSKRIVHYVSLENRMACGVGACRSCVVLTKEGDTEIYKTVCHDGPVFDAEDLVWDKLPDI